ncbi:MAG: hypothetical protein QOJ50_2552 [Cryptosporangiaceae bacterium]|nr:hypothetical protein [Cryptosporangiaceae bacterium]
MSKERIADDETTVIPKAERPLPVPTALAAAAATVLTALLYGSALASSTVFALAVLLVQGGLVAVWCLVSRPVGLVAVAAVPGAAAILSTGLLAFGADTSVAPAAAVLALSFIATIAAQLARRDGRPQLTAAFGSTMTLVVAVCALATLISLHRQIGGPAVVGACVGAAGAGLVVARLADLLLPRPTVNYAVPRGAVGVLAGALAGAGLAATSPALTDPMSVPVTALAGAGVALAAILADVGMSFAAAGRELIEAPRPQPPLRPLLGPLLGLALAAPAGYVFGLLIFA